MRELQLAPHSSYDRRLDEYCTHNVHQLCIRRVQSVVLFDSAGAGLVPVSASLIKLRLVHVC